MKCLWILFLATAVILTPARAAGEPAESATPVARIIPAEEAARQLRIYSEALYQGTSLDVRVDAAVGLLVREDKAGIPILTAALRATDNPAAVEAVCRALIKSRGLGRSIAPADEFVKPLFAVLAGPGEPLANLAGEALLLYPFAEIKDELKRTVEDPQQDQAIRLRGIYALQLRTETEALQILIHLLDDPVPEIARASEKALQESFGIPVGTNRQVWSGILSQLKNRSPEDIRRERLLRQEMKLREVQAERDRWRKLTLAAMDKEYELLDQSGKVIYLKERLVSDLAPIRVWGMQKVSRLTSDIDPEMRGLLLGLVSDENRDVRFQAAQVLSVMSALNPAETLLEQYKKETDPQVALALFEALGEACFFAFSPGSKIVLDESIREQTLEITAKYIQSEQATTSKSAAEILRKLLDLNSLPAEQAGRYLSLILERYNKTIGQDNVLRGDLLMVMARLCSQGAYKKIAGQIYKDSFLAGLQESDNPTVRLASIVGLSGINKNEAFGIIKEMNLIQDTSPVIRDMILELAGEIGTQKDLDWLFAFIQGNGNAESYWPTFRLILQKQSPEICLEWAKRFKENSIRFDWLRQVLQEADRKFTSAGQSDKARHVRLTLLQLSIDNNLMDSIINFGSQVFSYESCDKSQMIQYGPAYVSACLSQNQVQAVQQFYAKYLENNDINKNELLIPIDNYLDSPNNSKEQKAELVNLLSSISTPVPRTVWGAYINNVKEKSAFLRSKALPEIPNPEEN